MAEPPVPMSTRVHYMLALVRALTRGDGHLDPTGAYDWLDANGERRDQKPPSGVDPEMHFRREVRFARQELADAGVLASDGGAWRLVEPGVTISAEDARRMIRENRVRRQERRDRPVGGIRRSREHVVMPSGPTTGPSPSGWEGMVVRKDGPASTYAFRFGTSDVWKIGFAGDIEIRLREVNQHVPVELLGETWKLEYWVRWGCQQDAYRMEQEVLCRLAERRTLFERVRCSRGELKSAWNAASRLVEDEARRAKVAPSSIAGDNISSGSGK